MLIQNPIIVFSQSSLKPVMAKEQKTPGAFDNNYILKEMKFDANGAPPTASLFSLSHTQEKNEQIKASYQDQEGSMILKILPLKVYF